MYQLYSEHCRRNVCVALLLLLGAVGCATTPTGESSESQKEFDRDTAQVKKQRQQSVSPAVVDVDAGVGFTVTEAVSISSDVRADYTYALQLLAEGQTEAGIALLLEVTQKVPDATAPFVDLGIAYSQSGNFERATEAFQSALVATPDHPVAHNELGITYRRLGRFEDARASYERALAIYPGFHYARRNLAVLCDLYLADLSCALEQYENYQSIVRDDPEVGMWIADLRNRMGAAQ
jgi:Flp pilus assembly protein TadD